MRDHGGENQRTLEEIEGSRAFLVSGLGFSLNWSPDFPKRNRRPPRVLSTVRGQAVVRPVLILREKARKPVDAWHGHWAGYGRVVIHARTRKHAARVCGRMIDGISALFTLFHGMPKPHPFVPLRIPEWVIRRGWVVEQDLESTYKRAHGYSEDSYQVREFRANLSSSILIPEYTMAYIFFHLPVAVKNAALFHALHFYQESVSDYVFMGDSITDVLLNPTQRPESEQERVRLESSVLNAFRAVEALVGEPGRNEERFRHRLESVGNRPR